MNKVESVVLRLRGELKELFSPSIMVIDMEERNQEPDPPQNGHADIIVDVKNKSEVDDVREFLRTESDLSIIAEGPSPVLNREDHAFYLRVNE